MIDYTAKKSLIYDEFSEKEKFDFFDRTREKYIHNIDSLYYVAYVLNDFNNDFDVKCFIDYLEKNKIKAMDSLEPVVLHYIGTEYTISSLGFGMFAYSIEKKDEYIIFVSRTQATEDTPVIFVQLRSQFLWLYGEHEAVKQSFDSLTLILGKFNIEVDRIVENRIDYAYHTNYIQDPLNFFKEENLNKMQVSRFTRWRKEGRFVGDTDVECDYISLGRRKSNNTFVRIYNKSQEVVNQNYKQFFIQIWLLNNLINRFDYYVLEKCFNHSSYNYVDKARLEFYLNYGQDKNIKYKINDLLDKGSGKEIKKLADYLTPRLTIVCNIEIQTKRKFYSTMEESINLLKTVTFKDKELERLGKILDNKDLFHRFITNHIIRFVDSDSHTRKKNCHTANWWKRLQNIKLNNVISDKNRKLIREYQKDLDILNLKNRILNSISTFSLYLENENDNNVAKDTLSFLSFLNESDYEKSIKYKNKKSALLKNRLKDLDTLDISNDLLIVDSSTAEILNLD